MAAAGPAEVGRPGPAACRGTCGGWPPADPAVLATFCVTTPFGDQPFHLLFMRSVRLLRLADPPPPKASPPVPTPSGGRSSRWCGRCRWTWTVTLGSAELTLFDLAKLPRRATCWCCGRR